MASWFIVELTSEHVPLPEPPVVDPTQGGGGGRPFVHSAAPAFETYTVSIDGEIELLRLEKFGLQASFELRRRKTISLSGDTELLRRKSVSFLSAREPAHHYLKVKREDEELMLLI